MEIVPDPTTSASPSADAAGGSLPLTDGRFVRLGRRGCRAFIRPEFRAEGLESALLAGEPELQRRYWLEPVRSAPTSRVFRVKMPLGGQVRVVYYKEYLHRSAWDAVKHLARATRAMRAVKASHMLTNHAFRVPEVVAFGERRTAFVPGRCFVMTLDVSEAVSLSDLIIENHRRFDLSGWRRDRRELARTLGGIIGRMHRAGIVHGDLRSGNILARRAEDRWEVFFLDNERTRRWPWLPPHLRLKNLVQIGMLPPGVTATDRFRFWRAYLAECPGLWCRRKRWARRIQARTAKRMAKYD